MSTGQRAASELLKKVKQMAEAVKVVSKGLITYTDNADSVTFSTVCLDECAFIPFVDEIYQAIAPTLTRDKTS